MNKDYSPTNIWKAWCTGTWSHRQASRPRASEPRASGPRSQSPEAPKPSLRLACAISCHDICHTSACFQEQSTWRAGCNCWDTTHTVQKPDEVGFPTSAICKAALSIKSLLARVNQSDHIPNLTNKKNQLVTSFLCVIETHNQHGQHLFSGWLRKSVESVVAWAQISLDSNCNEQRLLTHKHLKSMMHRNLKPQAGQQAKSQWAKSQWAKIPKPSSPKAQPQVGMCNIMTSVTHLQVPKNKTPEELAATAGTPHTQFKNQMR